MMTDLELKDWYDRIKKKKFLYTFVGKRTKKENIKTLENAPSELFENEDFMLKAIENNHAEWPMISDKLLDNKEFVLKLINIRYCSVYSIPEKWRKDEDILLEIFKVNSHEYDSLITLEKYKDIKNNKDLAMKLLKLNPDVIFNIYFPFKKDVDIIKKAILLKPKLIEKYKKSFTKNLFDSIEDIKYILSKNPDALSYFSMRIRNMEPLVRECIKHNAQLIKYAGVKLKENEEFMLSYINFGYILINNLSKKLLTNREFMEKIVLNIPGYINYVEKKFLTDEWIIKLIKKNPNIYLNLKDKEQENELFIAYFLTHPTIRTSKTDYKEEKTVMVLSQNIIKNGFKEMDELNNSLIKKNNLNVYDYLEQKFLKILLEYEFSLNSKEEKYKKLKI